MRVHEGGSFTYRVQDLAIVELLHGVFGSARIVVFYKAVIETLVGKLLRKSARATEMTTNVEEGT